MSNEDFEKGMILFQIAQIDIAFDRAKEVIETQKLIGVMTPKSAELFKDMLSMLIKLQEGRNFLVELAREQYGMNIE